MEPETKLKLKLLHLQYYPETAAAQRPVHQLRFFFAIIQWRILSKSPAGYRKREPQRDRN